ncbi:ABC transporter substrate-binding protein [Candidatus Uhrbacteria bacterium]|nr:ABC transporter substrate-binding protein [Candidatus Uhrbacteria bacterium]
MRRSMMFTAAFAAFAIAGSEAYAQGRRFADVVGPVTVGPVRESGSYELPFILWGGEAATFHANGLSLTTKPGTIFAGQGFNFRLVPGDDFVGQVRRNLKGETPFLRGTFRMIGMAAEVLSQDPRTQPVVLGQMTWSRGDHVECVAGVRTVRDLRGKRIALQEFGPHVGMLDDVLKTGGLQWSDVKVVWVRDITGPNGPAATFKAGKADCAFVVTPDMLSLSGGLTTPGTGAEGTMKGAHVLVSTAELTRSIADVYAVRKDWYDAHRDVAMKFAAAYLKGAEEIVELGRNKRAPAYRNLLTFMVKTYTPSVLPNEAEADGLIMDCAFVGHPGNVAFFTEKGNDNGFAAFTKSSLDMAVKTGIARTRGTIHAAAWNWAGPPFAGYLQHMGEVRGQRFKAEATISELEALAAGGGITDRIIYGFSVPFELDQADFSAAQYRAQFDEALTVSRKYGGAVIAVRGHADPGGTIIALVRSGIECKVLEQRGSPGAWKYFLNGGELVLANARGVAAAIESGRFDCSTRYRPREILQRARTLSEARARAVRDALVAYAKSKGITIDVSQFQSQGAGIAEPLVPTPRSPEDQVKNMRVEFAIVRVSAEAVSPADFDY